MVLDFGDNFDFEVGLGNDAVFWGTDLDIKVVGGRIARLRCFWT